MRILVTGAAGFIGSQLVERLINEGHTVMGIDGFSSTYSVASKRANCAAALATSQYRLVEGQLGELDLPALLAGVDAVVHLAGEPGVRNSWGNRFAAYVERNIVATQILLEAVTRSRVRRFVFASSSAVYGDSGRGTVDEASPLQPTSPYGVTKLTSEKLCGAYEEKCAFPMTILRYFTVYGPRQRPDMAVAEFLSAALRRHQVTVYGDGRQVRQFTYVADVVDATVRALNPETPSGEVLNIAAETSVTLLELAERVSGLVGRKIDICFQAMQPGDSQMLRGSNKRARELLGWIPAVSLETGLSRQLDWLRRTGEAAVPIMYPDQGRSLRTS